MNKDYTIRDEDIPEQAKVKSLYKALQLLFMFTETDRELGVTELAKQTGMLKASVYNMLSTFEVCRLIKKNPETNKYHLGVRVLELVSHFYECNDICQIALPHMSEIANQVEETVFLGMRWDDEILYLEGAFPRYSTAKRNMAGIKAPLYCTAIGKAILAFTPGLSEHFRDIPMVSYTSQTLTRFEDLEKDLEKTRQRGYAIDNMEHEYGVRCVAVPIRNSADDVVGAMSITGPSLRFEDARLPALASLLMRHTAEMKPQLIGELF